MVEHEKTLVALREVVGAEYLLAQPAVLRDYATATFAHHNRVRAVVLPSSLEEVQRLIEVANQHRLHLHPVSRGRNWGLGSRVPVSDGNIVVDLARMNRICDFNEELGFVTVEPGVTFRQLADYLAARGSQLYAAVIGGPPDASLIGNALERGDGLGPLGERSDQCCALEAVDGRGELLRTGLQPYGSELLSKLWSPGVGPSLQGLLMQSNFAIVTRMTIWLARKPDAFQGVCFAVSDTKVLPQLTAAMRRLQFDGVLKPNSYALWNPYKLLASLMQYPWTEGGRPYTTPQQLLSHLPRGFRKAEWIGMAGLYSVDEAHARAERRLLRKAISKYTSQLVVFNRRTVKMIRPVRGLLAKLGGMDPELLIRLLYTHSPFLGHPTEFSTASTYWRKHTARPAVMHPDRDRCGLHWVCTVLPFDGDQIRRHAALIEETALAHDLEPNISYLNASPRLLKCFAVIAFDRDSDDEERRARACHDEMLQRLMVAGYPPIRLGVQSMKAGLPRDPAYASVIRRLKNVFDPNRVIAPGHYDFQSPEQPEQPEHFWQTLPGTDR